MITAEQIQQLLNAQNNNDFISVAKIANELLQIAPENDFLLQAKATALFNQANYFDAIQTIKTALQIYPKNNQLLNSFASMLKILTQNVNNIFDDNLLLFLAQTCKDLSFFASAVIFYRQLYNKNQNQNQNTKFLLDYIYCLQQSGDAEIAHDLVQQTPSSEFAKTSIYILLNNYCSFITCQQMGEIARRRAELIAKQIPQKNFDFDKYKQQFLLNFHENSKNFSENLVEKNSSSPRKKLKIGVVVSTFMLNEWVSAIFRQLCKNHWQTLEIHLYLIRHDNSIVADKNHCDFYQSVQDITHLNDQQSADKIYNDGVHILISTISHAFYGRLPMFAMKPSPIQFSWINWFGTSGIPTMDYFPVSNFDVPNQQYAQQFNEKPLYFPDLWCLVPKNEMAEKFYKKRPFSENIMNKNIVFGNFNIPEKITPQTLKLWALALNAVENSQLIYMRGTLVDNALCEKYFQELAKYNVKNLRQRVQFIANKTREEYFDCYQHIDFVLDAFPASGGATIADSLQMSVPALTVTGNLVIGRMAGSFLKAVGLENWICQNETEFVEKVKYFAAPNQRKYLNDLHNNLREITLKSAICDAELFAKNFEIKMWEIWNDFLNS